MYTYMYYIAKHFALSNCASQLIHMNGKPYDVVENIIIFYYTVYTVVTTIAS